MNLLLNHDRRVSQKRAVGRTSHAILCGQGLHVLGQQLGCFHLSKLIMASLLNEPWIKTLLDEELNEAISWKSSALPNALVKIKKEGNSNGRFAFGNDRFIDDGSNLTIRPCDGNASGHSAQIFKVCLIHGKCLNKVLYLSLARLSPNKKLSYPMVQ